MDSTNKLQQDYYTTEEAAIFLGLTHGTTRWHIYEGHLTPVPYNEIPQEMRRFLRKNAPIFTRQELDRFVDEKKVVGKPAKNSSKKESDE